MNQSAIERGLMLLGALLLGLFALGFAVPSLRSWQGEIRLLMILGVVLYAGYSFWTQSKDAKELHTKAQEMLKWRQEAEMLRSSLLNSQQDLAEARAATAQAEAATQNALAELKTTAEALQACRDSAHSEA